MQTYKKMELHTLTSVGLLAVGILLASSTFHESLAQDPQSRSVETSIRVDQSLGTHATLPQFDGRPAQTGIDVPQFLPAWIFGQPLKQQPLFARDGSDASAVMRVRRTTR